MTTILGHAGTAAAPPNTLESFQSVISQHADGTELDVQMTKDGRIVCIHDEHLERLTDGSGLVGDHTYEELCGLNASISVPGYPRTHIPLLSEALDLFASAGTYEINIEIKSTMVIYPGIEQAILDVVAESPMRDRVFYSSFNHYSLLKIRELDPRSRIAPLYSTGLAYPWKYVASLGAEGVHPFFLNLTSADQMVPGLDPIAEFHRHGIVVRAWTVDDPRTLLWLFDHNVDAVITNVPGQARQILERSIADAESAQQTHYMQGASA